MAPQQTPPSWDTLKPVGTTPATGAPPPAPGSRPPVPNIQVSSPTSVQLPPDWNTLQPAIMSPPPGIDRPRLPLPKTGPPNFTSDVILPAIVDSFLPAIGGSAGSAAFKGLGLLPRIVGAMTGAASGETTTAMAESAWKGTPMPTTGEMATRAATAATGEAVAPGAAMALRYTRRLPIRALGAAFRSRMSPEAREMAEFAGGKVTPGQISDSPFVQLMDNFASATFGRGRYNKVYAEAEQELIGQAEREIASFGPRADPIEAGTTLRQGMVDQVADQSRRELGVVVRRGQELTDQATEAVSEGGRALERVSQRFGPAQGVEATGGRAQSLIEQAHDAADRAQSQVYNELWERTAGEALDVQPLIARAQQLAGEAGSIGKATGVQGRAGRAVGALEAAGQAEDDVAAIPGMEYAQNALALMDPADPRRMRLAAEANAIAAELVDATTMSPQQVHRLRSFYGRMGRTVAGPEKGVFKQLHAAADEILETQLDEASLEQYRTASKMHEAMKQTFEEGLFATVVKKKPAEVVKTLLGTKGALSDFRLARETLGDDEWRNVQAQVWNDVIRTPNGAMKTPAQVLTELQKWSPDEVKEVFKGADDLIGQAQPALTAADLAKDVPKQVAKQTEAAITAADRRIAATGAKPMYDLVEKTVTKADPEQILKLRAFVGEDGWRQVASSHVQHLFERPQNATDVVAGSKLASRLMAEGDRLEATVGKDTANFLHQWARISQTLTKKSPMGDAGRMYLQLATPAAAAGVLTLDSFGSPRTTVTAGMILLAPYMMARIATSPAMQRALIGASQATIKGETGIASRYVSQLVAHLVRAQLIGPEGGPPVPEAAASAGGPGAGAGRGTTQPLGRSQGPGPGALAGPPRPPVGPPPSPPQGR